MMLTRSRAHVLLGVSTIGGVLLAIPWLLRLGAEFGAISLALVNIDGCRGSAAAAPHRTLHQENFGAKCTELARARPSDANQGLI